MGYSEEPDLYASVCGETERCQVLGAVCVQLYAFSGPAEPAVGQDWPKFTELFPLPGPSEDYKNPRVLTCSSQKYKPVSPLWIAILLSKFQTHNAIRVPLPSVLLTEEHKNICARTFTEALFEENWKGPKCPG